MNKAYSNPGHQETNDGKCKRIHRTMSGRDKNLSHQTFVQYTYGIMFFESLRMRPQVVVQPMHKNALETTN